VGDSLNLHGPSPFFFGSSSGDLHVDDGLELPVFYAEPLGNVDVGILAREDVIRCLYAILRVA
jgi:hypothetical protein